VNILPFLNKVIERTRIAQSPVVFSEASPSNTCVNTYLSGSDDCIAVRIRSNDHLKLLKGNPGQSDGYCNLPDFMVFREEHDRIHGNEIVILKVLLAEMKSSDVALDLAIRQLQLGTILMPYLLAAARLDFAITAAVEVRQCALLISPDLPEPKGRTRRSKTQYECETLMRVGIPRYDIPCGAEISFDEFSYWKSDLWL
jgi:hypothetical protein